MQKSHEKMVNPRDVAGKCKREEELVHLSKYNVYNWTAASLNCSKHYTELHFLLCFSNFPFHFSYCLQDVLSYETLL